MIKTNYTTSKKKKKKKKKKKTNRIYFIGSRISRTNHWLHTGFYSSDWLTIFNDMSIYLGLYYA